MALHERQQFDFLLWTATERFSERVQQHLQGPERALAALSDATQYAKAGVTEFVDAIFADFLLDNIEGACFVLQSVGKRKWPTEVSLTTSVSVEQGLIQVAKYLFQQLLISKTIEYLEQFSSYQPMHEGDH